MLYELNSISKGNVNCINSPLIVDVWPRLFSTTVYFLPVYFPSVYIACETYHQEHRSIYPKVSLPTEDQGLESFEDNMLGR